MKRVGLKQEFNGEPNPMEEGLAISVEEQDEVTLDVTGGTLSFIVPSDTPDHQVFQSQYFERYLNGVLKLENGLELNFWVNSGALGIDIRTVGSQPAKQLGSSPNVRI